MKIIFDYNRTIFNPDTNNLYDGVLEILEELFLKHELFLVSKYEPTRSNVINKLEINKYFQKIVLVEQKTEEIFIDLVGENKDVVVVGDRIKREIYLGNLLGFNTVWVRQGKFSNEINDTEEEKPDYVIKDIKELLEIIKKYE
jgi:FMN phosphatase YigB (HAD superfamily)